MVQAADTNLNFARWEKEIAAFERADATNPPPKGAMLFTGSSTIRLWHTLAADITNGPVINRGFGGSTIADSVHFAERTVFPYVPGKIFFRAGGNDIAEGKSPETVFADFKEFVAKVHAKLPETEIVYISWSPSLARWNQADKEKALNQLIADYIQGKPYLRYLETYDMVLGADGKPRAELFVADKLHFNAAGYKLLAARVREFLANDR
jgi:lysophospholipase L1-like esterase